MNDTVSAKDLIDTFAGGVLRELDQQRASITVLYQNCEEFKVEITLLKFKVAIISAIGGSVGAGAFFLIKLLVFGV
jgi:hypothetical protein